METGFRNSVIEALILASPEPLARRKIVDLIEDATPSVVNQSVAELNNRYMEAGSSFRIREIAGGYQFHIVPEFAGFVQEMFTRRRKMRLTRASLETLAIVAYRQPVTKAEIEHIRGVASDGVLRNLLEKSLVAIKGRADTVGKPLQYGTTNEFLQFFGLSSLSELPKMAEIEEMIRSSRSEGQTELELGPDEFESKLQKLNIADGTYQPRSEDETDELDNDDTDAEDREPAESSESDPDDMPAIETVEDRHAQFPGDNGDGSYEETETADQAGRSGGVIFDMQESDGDEGNDR
jgi:segregation and condensation protein B